MLSYTSKFKSKTLSPKFMRPWPRYIPRVWPICSAFRVGQVLISLCLWFHEASFLLFVCRAIIGGVCASGWVRELIVEGSYLGMYTSYTQEGLKCAVILFIVSEAMFFFSFF